MDLFLSPDVLDLTGDVKIEESDDEEAAVGDFDSFLLGRDDIKFICSQEEEEVFTGCLDSVWIETNSF